MNNNPLMNLHNDDPIRNEAGGYKITKENAREMQLKGAEQKKINTARRRSMQEIARWLGEMAVNKKQILNPDEIVELDKAQSVHMTGAEAIMLAQYQKALLGDTESAKFIRDTAGEKPVEKIETITIEDYVKEHKVKF